MRLRLADQSGGTGTLIIDATHLKAHRTASNLWLKKGGRGRVIGRTKGVMTAKRHVVTDTAGRPLRMFLSACQCSDYIGGRAVLQALPPAKYLLVDRGYDADWYREGLEKKGITP